MCEATVVRSSGTVVIANEVAEVGGRPESLRERNTSDMPSLPVTTVLFGEGESARWSG